MLCMALVICILLVLVLSWLLFMRISENKRITAQMRELTGKDSNTLIHTGYSTESIRELVGEINRLYEKLRRQEIATIRKSERLDMMLANISHDLRTPLTSALGYIDMINRSFQFERNLSNPSLPQVTEADQALQPGTKNKTLAVPVSEEKSDEAVSGKVADGQVSEAFASGDKSKEAISGKASDGHASVAFASGDKSKEAISGKASDGHASEVFASGRKTEGAAFDNIDISGGNPAGNAYQESEIRQELEIVEKRLHRLSELIDEFFEFSKIISSGKEPEKEELSLNAVLEESIVHYYDDYNDRSRKIVFENGIGRMKILSNRNMLLRIFDNLIGNALKHGIGDLFIRLEDSEGIRISFSNSVPDENIDTVHIFDEFYTKDISRTGGNTGLGLAIAKEFTELLGGKISAEVIGGQLVIIIRI